MNNREAMQEAMQKQFEDSNFYTCGESQSERLANWNVWKDAWNACLASQAQQDHIPDATKMVQSQAQQEPNFQARVKPWMMECFGAEISADSIERNHRFLEEALELVQACDCTQSEAHQLVDYVFGRPVGEKNQEVGGVMVTLAALCLAQGLDMHEAGETELARIWTKVAQIRAKQAAKPKHSPLPQAQQEPVKQEGWIPTMDIHSKQGDKVVFSAHHGLESSKNYAKGFLKVGEIYEVEFVDIHRSASYVKLKGFEGTFNTVMFSPAPEGESK